jgi:uncharacterized protein
MAADPASSQPAPASPCIGICLLDPATGRCRGCLRNVAEIATWSEASAAEKLTILSRIAERSRLDKGRPPERPE